MSNRSKPGERVFWVAVVAVLATSLMWVSALAGGALLVTHFGPAAQALVVLRALCHVAMILTMRFWPALPLFALGGIMLVLDYLTHAPLGRKARRV